MRIERIKEHIGALVEVDRSRLGDPDVGAACRQALEDHGVLVFPKMHATDDEQLAFTDAMGGRIDYTNIIQGGQHGTEGIYTVTLNPEINTQAEYVWGTYFWHIDGINMDIPALPKATVLNMRHNAEKGGDTHFANTYKAWELMPEDEKAEIEQLFVTYEPVPFRKTYVENPTEDQLERWNKNPINTFPIVWTHESGRKSILLSMNAARVVGWDLPESRALFERVREWCVQPDLVYKHKWNAGDMVIWDNHGTMHRVTPYAIGSRREMARTTVKGNERSPRYQQELQAAE